MVLCFVSRQSLVLAKNRLVCLSDSGLASCGMLAALDLSENCFAGASREWAVAVNGARRSGGADVPPIITLVGDPEFGG